MANVLNGNTFYVHTASTTTVGSYLSTKDVLVEAIILAADVNSEVEVCDLKNENGVVVAGDVKLHLHALAHESYMNYFNGTPIRFPNGIWVSSITAGCKLTLLVKVK